ncbi:MAG: hypothetical protein ACI86H_000570, partial [bacterium]
MNFILEKRVLLGFVLLLFFLMGCKDEASSESNCLTLLDAKEFSSIILTSSSADSTADGGASYTYNSSCSSYEKASAHLGKGNFLVSNFLVDGAADNLVSTLGITSESSSSTTFYTQLNHYRTASTLTKNSSETLNTEIHFIAGIGQLAVETFGRIDSDLNGTVSETEVKSFTKIKSSTTGSNTINVPGTYVYQIIDGSSDAYVFDSSLTTSSCYSDTDHDGSGDSAASSTNCTNALSSATSAYIVILVDDLQQMFESTATTSDVTTAFNFLSDVTTKLGELDTDLATLGLTSDSSLRKSMKETKDELDNGGTCTSTEKDALDTLEVILQYSNESTQSSYSGYNEIPSSAASSLTSISSSIPTSLSTGNTTVDNAFKGYKMLYKVSTDSYIGAFTSA